MFHSKQNSPSESSIPRRLQAAYYPFIGTCDKLLVVTGRSAMYLIKKEKTKGASLQRLLASVWF